MDRNHGYFPHLYSTSYSKKLLTVLFRSVKVKKDKARLRNCHRLEEATETKTTECEVRSWNGSWTRKRTLMTLAKVAV